MIVPESDQLPPSAKPPTSDHGGENVWEVVGIGLGFAVVGVQVALPGSATGALIIAIALAWWLAFGVTKAISWAHRTSSPAGRRGGYLLGVLGSAAAVLAIVGGLYLGPLSGGNQAVATPSPSPTVCPSMTLTAAGGTNHVYDMYNSYGAETFYDDFPHGTMWVVSTTFVESNKGNLVRITSGSYQGVSYAGKYVLVADITYWGGHDWQSRCP
jgi:hypothetical protein